MALARCLALFIGVIWTLLGLFTSSSVATPTRFANTTWDDGNWTLRTTSFESGRYQSRASLANGYIGINVAALGPFFEVDVPVDGDNVNGWPLFDRRQTFATIAGFYDEQPRTEGSNFDWLYQLGGESVISGVPHWAGLIIETNGHVLNASTERTQIKSFSSALNMKSAHLTWKYVWMVPQGPEIEIEYSLFVHKLFINQAVTQLKMVSSQNANVSVADVLDGDCATRTVPLQKGYEPQTNSMWTAVQPMNIPNVTAYVYSTLVGDGQCGQPRLVSDVLSVGGNASSIAQYFDVNMKAGTQAVITKFVGIASSDAFPDPRQVARRSSIAGSETGYDSLFASHALEWANIMHPESVDDFKLPNGTIPADQDIIDHQIMAVTNPFAILQNTVGTNAIRAADNNSRLDINSIAVGGLTSDSYAGLIFWDVEVWMQPGLLLAFPEAAKQIANYRLEKYPQAKQNVYESYTSSQNETIFSSNAAIYPWTSGRFGNCTGTGPCFDYEYHLNGDIALELENYYFVSGDISGFRNDYFPIYNSIAEAYSNLLYLNTTTSTYMLMNATDPDEFANAVDNPAYTMVLIKTTLDKANAFRQQFGMGTNDNWTHQAANIEIPTNQETDIILEYTSMNGTISVKQADVVLVDDFLHFPNPYTMSDLDFYSGKQSLDGPGMTYGVFSNIASSSSPSGCSDYTYDLYGSLPYTRGPWYQYSEQLIDNFNVNGGFHPAFPFLTGMGGANRVSPFGYLGLKLRNDTFEIDPLLPPQIPHLSYRMIFWQGHAINVKSNATHTTLRRGGRKLATANKAFTDSPIPVRVGNQQLSYNLGRDSALVVSNRQPFLVKTVPGNLAQCLPVVSNQTYLPGQFPLAAVDGAASTSWRPSQSNVSASMTVTLGEAGIVPIGGFALDWAREPPETFSIAFSNSSTPSAQTFVYAVSNQKVVISEPYDPSRVAVLEPYVGNTTNVTLGKPMWGGRYATLVIVGNQAGNTSTTGASDGASVAEWAILAAYGSIQ